MGKSHRKIEPERLSDHIINEVIESHIEKPQKVEGAQKIPDRLQPTLRTKIRAKYRDIKQSIKGVIAKMFSKKAENFIRKNIPDNTLWGKVLFGILDSVPVPQMHEVWKAVQKEIPDASMGEKLKLYWQKVDGVRTLVSVAVSVATAYYVIN